MTEIDKIIDKTGIQGMVAVCSKESITLKFEGKQVVLFLWSINAQKYHRAVLKGFHSPPKGDILIPEGEDGITGVVMPVINLIMKDHMLNSSPVQN